MESFSVDVFEALTGRRSIRKYLPKPVEEEKINRILDAARLGPSAANKQPCAFVVVTRPEVRESLRASYRPDWFVGAPVIVVCCVDPKAAWQKGGEEY